MKASHNDVNNALTDILKSGPALDIQAVGMVLSMCRGRLNTYPNKSRELSLAITKIQEAEMWLDELEKVEIQEVRDRAKLYPPRP